MHPCIRTSQHATTVCLLTRDATMRRGAATTDAAALSQAMACKERTKSELAVKGFRAHLVVLGAEIGGRWLPETQDFSSGRAAQKARSVPARVPEQGHCSMAARVDVGSSRNNARGHEACARCSRSTSTELQDSLRNRDVAVLVFQLESEFRVLFPPTHPRGESGICASV